MRDLYEDMKITKFSYRFYPNLSSSQSGLLGQVYLVDDRNSNISGLGITAKDML
jgi:hypothetical protein